MTTAFCFSIIIFPL